MNVEELKALQAPIKERYRKDPGAALITLRAEGDLDFRGTLGVAKDAPVGFRDIRVHFKLDTDAAQEQVKKLVELTERYCGVMQTIRNAVPVRVS